MLPVTSSRLPVPGCQLSVASCYSTVSLRLQNRNTEVENHENRELVTGNRQLFSFLLRRRFLYGSTGTRRRGGGHAVGLGAAVFDLDCLRHRVSAVRRRLGGGGGDRLRGRLRSGRPVLVPRTTCGEKCGEHQNEDRLPVTEHDAISLTGFG